MEIKSIKTNEDFNLFIKELKYGTTDVFLDSDICIDLLNSYVDLCDNMSKNILVSLKTSEVEGAVSVIWHERTMAPPVFNVNELGLQSIVAQVAERKESLIVSIRKELVKYAGKLAKSAGIKFNDTVFGQSFSAVGAKKSAYKIIEEAIEAGEDQVQFSKSDYNPQTIRVYSSQINKFKNIKTSVSISGDTITLMLTKKNSFSLEIMRLFTKSEETEGLQETLYMFYKTIQAHSGKRHITDAKPNEKWHYIEETIIAADPADIATNYITENPLESIDMALDELVMGDGLEIEDYHRIKAILNPATEGVLTLIDVQTGADGGIVPHTPPIEPAALKTGISDATNRTGSAEDPQIEIVDGMRQGVIPGLREQIDGSVKSMPEDSDF